MTSKNKLAKKQGALTQVPLKAELSHRSFADRVSRGSFAGASCLLLDTSSSMSIHCSNGKARIKMLREVVEKLPTGRMFSFNCDVEEIFGDEIPEPCGGTNMEKALYKADQEGLSRAVLITDGEPNSRERTLVAARATGIKLDIVYIGDGEMPPFLQELADICGGSCSVDDISETALLADKVKGLLGQGSSASKESQVIAL